MEQEAIYERGVVPLTNDVDFAKRMKPSAILNVFQEIAGTHAESLNAGYDALAKMGMFWVLSRIRFEAANLPRYGERLTARTWPVKAGNIYFERDYELLDARGDVAVAATSVWCVLDSRSHKVVPARNLDLYHVELSTRRALGMRKLRPGGTCVKKLSRKVLPGDLDYNMHVNNTRYADYVYDAFDLDYLKEHAPISLQIHYQRETHCGDALEIEVGENGENTYLVAGREAGNEVFFAEIGFA